MTRNGKIARLPRAIRDELNRRLENGEQAVQLVSWLNAAPEVREILRTEFEGRPINEVNLTDWKNGGFLDWQAQQEALALIRELKFSGAEFAAVQPGELTEPLMAAVVAQYAAAVYRSNTDTAEKPSERVRRLGKSLRDLDRLRRREQARERIEIQRQWLELERQKTEQGIRKKFEEWAADTDFRDSITPKMTKEEKDRGLYRLIYGRDPDENEK